MQDINSNIKEILNSYSTVAIVGLSNKSYRPSFGVGSFLKRMGYKIYPVNPKIDKVLGEKSYPSLLELPEQIEVVDIFRRPQFVDEIVDQAIQIKAKAVWMQMGVINEKAAQKALDAGLKVVMDRCIKIEYKKWMK
jgi:predicted CoA-binding protein